MALAAAAVNPGVAHAATRTWIGLGLTNNWSEAANWLPAVVPGAGDTAVFDGTGVKNATIDIPSVQGVAINAGYTGTISQATGNPLTIGTADFRQAAGTFVGGNSAITVNDAFVLSGGSFTSTTATLTVTGAFTLSGGTFAHNGGTVAFSGGASTINLGGSATFNHVSFLGPGTKTISAGNTMTVLGTLSLTDGQVSTGTVAAQGDISVASTFDGGTGTLLLNGGGAQAWTDVFGPTASLPVVNINKPSGTLTMSGTFRTTRSWTYTSGGLDASGSTVIFAGTLTVSGSHVLSAVQIAGAVTIAAGTTLTAAGNLTLTSGSLATGTLASQADVTAALGYTGGGTATLLLNGSGAQTLTGLHTSTTGSLPNLVINKPSGTLTISGTLRTARNWTYLSGGLDASGSTVIFAGTQTVSGSHTLDAVEVRGGTLTIAAGTTLTAAGDLTLTSGSLATGTLAAQADVTAASSFSGGSATLLIDGSGSQTFSGAATPTTGSLPNLVINKPSGTLTLAGTIRTIRSWTWTAGSLDAAGSTVIFAGSLTVSGSHILDAVEVRGGTLTIAAGTTLTAAGNLTLTSGSLATGTLAAQADVTAALGYTGGGTGTLLLNGGAAQTLTGLHTSTAGSLPNVVINKSSGTLTISGTLRTARNWTLTAGSVDPGTSLVVMVGTQLVSGAVIPFHDLTVNGGGVSLTTSGQITVDGTLALVQGVLNAGSGTVSIGPTGTVVRTAGHVAGALRKPVPVGTGVVVTFEVGDTTVYTPITLTLGSVSMPGSMVASSIPGDHPDIAASVINPAASVNRHWVLRNEATAFDTLDLTLTFVVADVDPGARTDRFVVGKRDATWTAPTVGPALPTSITAIGITSLSEFAVGEAAPIQEAPVPTPTSLPTPTPPPAAPTLPNTIGQDDDAGEPPALPWLLLGAMGILAIANVGARRLRQRR